ncbi:hypothetical protein XK09_05200 [Campylobacter lanienae]|uniref:Uncharacterized protein n=1 Tax=Campylobacter lanienae TaxID=75658 RepID=A0ABY3G7P8_9BACT|nr:hypothetical protein [Campylobacter lanienae]TWO28862.1 hypothetical protein XK09_05200 [Campylobacter lanienae]
MNKTEIVFVPQDIKETEFRLEKYPNFKKNLESSCKVIYDYSDIPPAIQNIRQKSVDQIFARSQIYMDRYYEIQEFEKSNADDLAEVVDQILLKMGAKERKIDLECSEESDERSSSNIKAGLKGKFSPTSAVAAFTSAGLKSATDKVVPSYGASATYEMKYGEENYNFHKLREESGFTSSGDRTDYKELKLWIEENKIDIDGLPKWLKPHLKHYLEGGSNRPGSISEEKEKLTINEYVRNKSHEIKLALEVAPIFKASLNGEYFKEDSSSKIYAIHI